MENKKDWIIIFGLILLACIIMFIIINFQINDKVNLVWKATNEVVNLKTTNQEVFDKLNSCEVILLEGIDANPNNFQDCNQVCNYNMGEGSACLLSFNENKDSKSTRVSSCEGDFGEFSKELEYTCVCCNP